MMGARPWGLGLLALLPALAGARDLGEIEKRGVLRVLAVVAKDDEFLTDQPGGGLDRELLEGFAKLRQLRLEVVAIDTWDGLVPALVKGDGDIIAGRFTVTEVRRKQIDFTPEVFPTRNVVLTRKPHRVVSTLEELRGERVGTGEGDEPGGCRSRRGGPGRQRGRRRPHGPTPGRAPVRSGQRHRARCRLGHGRASAGP